MKTRIDLRVMVGMALRCNPVPNSEPYDESVTATATRRWIVATAQTSSSVMACSVLHAMDGSIASALEA